MGFYVMLRDAEKLVPAKYWCPYGTYPNLFNFGAVDFSECHSI